ncbi:hypothetical protein PHISP_01663 [Aspergillus sp. HF37]|nr:hypothetical protein PHISP_01663 [Aspergillus sp. HF37]
MTFRSKEAPNTSDRTATWGHIDEMTTAAAQRADNTKTAQPTNPTGGGNHAKLYRGSSDPFSDELPRSYHIEDIRDFDPESLRPAAQNKRWAASHARREKDGGYLSGSSSAF